PLSSKISGSLFVQQDFPLSGSVTGFGSAQASYVGNRKGSFAGSAQDTREEFLAYTKTDLRAGVKYESWTINLYVNNVANTRGILSYSYYTPLRYFYIQPRTIGLNLAKTF